MPYTDGKYTNPGWVNNAEPPISAANLNDLSNAVADLTSSSGGGGGINKNLLTNWCFLVPVNQRGKYSYTSSNTQKVMTIDTWGIKKGTITLPNDGTLTGSTNTTGITLTSGCTLEGGAYSDDPQSRNYASVEWLSNQKTTFSIIVDGKLYSHSTGSTHSISGDNFTARLVWSTEYVYVRIQPTAEIKVLAVKLELGTEQTLAHQEGTTWVLNEVPIFLEELAKCQRYLLVIKGPFGQETSTDATTLGVCALGSLFLSTPVTMRVAPAITVSRYDNIQYKEFGGGSGYLSSLSAADVLSNGLSLVTNPKFSGALFFNVNSTDQESIIFSAEL